MFTKILITDVVFLLLFPSNLSFLLDCTLLGLVVDVTGGTASDGNVVGAGDFDFLPVCFLFSSSSLFRSAERSSTSVMAGVSGVGVKLRHL